MRTIFIRISTRTGDDITSVNMDNFKVFDDQQYHVDGYFPTYNVQLNEDLPDPILTKICKDLKTLPDIKCHHTLKVLEKLGYKNSPNYVTSCDACNVTTEDIKMCKSCKVCNFCPKCMSSKNHTGIFHCKICDEESCNSFKSPRAPVGYLDEFDYCWSCFVSTSTKNIRLDSDNLTQTLTPEQSQQLDSLTDSIIAMAGSTVK